MQSLEQPEQLNPPLLLIQLVPLQEPVVLELVTTTWNAVPAVFEDSAKEYVRQVSNFVLLQPFRTQPVEPVVDQVS